MPKVLGEKMILFVVFVIIGFLLLFFEQKNYRSRKAFIKDFIQKTRLSSISKDEQEQIIRQFFLSNSFFEISKGVFAKKEFFLGIFLAGFISLGLFSLLYFLYYKYIQKPDKFYID